MVICFFFITVGRVLLQSYRRFRKGSLFFLAPVKIRDSCFARKYRCTRYVTCDSTLRGPSVADRAVFSRFFTRKQTRDKASTSEGLHLEFSVCPLPYGAPYLTLQPAMGIKKL